MLWIDQRFLNEIICNYLLIFLNFDKRVLDVKNAEKVYKLMLAPLRFVKFWQHGHLIVSFRRHVSIALDLHLPKIVNCHDVIYGTA